jgi:hypothetical protein
MTREKKPAKRAKPVDKPTIVLTDVAGKHIFAEKIAGEPGWIALDLSSAESLVALASQIGLVVFDDYKTAMRYAIELAEKRATCTLPTAFELVLRACKRGQNCDAQEENRLSICRACKKNKVYDGKLAGGLSARSRVSAHGRTSSSSS